MSLREAVRVLMQSPFYFRFEVAERMRLVKELRRLVA
jgi:hypothetical protein